MRKIILLATTCTVALGFVSRVQASEDIFKKSGCIACHAVDKRVVGPALKDIAAKYKGQGDAVAKLSEKVRKGGAGVWGPIPMPPNDASKISDADLKVTMEWVLSR